MRPDNDQKQIYIGGEWRPIVMQARQTDMGENVRSLSDLHNRSKSQSQRKKFIKSIE